MQIGSRIYFNQNGTVICTFGEMSDNVLPRIENEQISYIDLPFGDTTLQGVMEFHIEDNQIVIDRKIEHITTPEEQRIAELENQLLEAEGVI